MRLIILLGGYEYRREQVYRSVCSFRTLTERSDGRLAVATNGGLNIFTGGKGYPNGLAREEIPEIARMIAVADTFDDMYSTRPYRKQMALCDVIAEIKRVSGAQLSPKVVDVFLQHAEEGAFDKPIETPELLYKENVV